MKEMFRLFHRAFIVLLFLKVISIFILLLVISCTFMHPGEDPDYYYIDKEFFNDQKYHSDKYNAEEQTTMRKTNTVESKWGYYIENEKSQSGVESSAKSIPEPEKLAVMTNTEYGKASYYGSVFHGRPTASGELYDRNKLTAAHLKLPFGTICRVTNLANSKSVEVKINDRGPHVKSRIIDLSYKAMSLIDGINAGIINVRLDVLK